MENKNLQGAPNLAGFFCKKAAGTHFRANLKKNTKKNALKFGGLKKKHLLCPTFIQKYRENRLCDVLATCQ